MEADARYVKKAGDTMTGALTLKGRQSDAFNSVGLLFTGNSGRIGTNTNNGLGIYAGGNLYLRPGSLSSSSGKGVEIGTSLFEYNGYTVWHSGNDGSGSGLDADLLDGYQASEFMRSFWTNNPGYSGSTYALEPFITFSYSNNTPYTGALAHIAASGYGFYLNTAYNANTRLAFRRFGKTSDDGMGPWYNLMDEGHDIYTSGKLYIPSSSGNQVFDAYIA